MRKFIYNNNLYYVYEARIYSLIILESYFANKHCTSMLSFALCVHWKLQTETSSSIKNKTFIPYSLSKRIISFMYFFTSCAFTLSWISANFWSYLKNVGIACQSIHSTYDNFIYIYIGIQVLEINIFFLRMCIAMTAP